MCISFLQKKQIQNIFTIGDSTTPYVKKKFFFAEFLIHCEAHCKKMENCFIYILKKVIDIYKILAVLSSYVLPKIGKLCRQSTVHCQKKLKIEKLKYFSNH